MDRPPKPPKCLTCLLVLAFPLLLAQGQEQEKTVADFENEAELKLLEPGEGVKLELSADKVKSGKKSLKVSLPTGPYPGFSLNVKDGNWMGADVLRLRVHSTKRVAFGIRADGPGSRSYDTRFNLETELFPGWNLFQIPLTDMGQKIDVTKVRTLVLFAMSPPAGLEVHVDDIRLGRKLDEPAKEATADVPLEKGPDFDLSGLELTPLLSFEDPRDLRSASVEGEEKFEIAADKAKSGKTSFKLLLPKGPYPGVSFVPPSKDWRGFDLLLVWVHADQPLKFGVRIDDTLSEDYYTRFNKDGLAVGAGWNPVVVDLKEVGEAIELTAIKKLVLFVPDCPGASLHIDDIALGRHRARARTDTPLLGFEEEADLKAIDQAHPVSLSEEQASAGKKALKVILPPGDWPGINISPPITDWSGFDTVKFDVYAPRNSGFGIRIDDVNSRDYNSRYNEEGVILAGWNTYQVDLRKVKPVNPARIRALVLFLMKNPEPTTLYFDNFRLGPYEEDLRGPVPGEEGPRRDIQYSTEVETPHRKWAKPHHSGKIRVFAIPAIQHGRDLAELMQRMELDVTAVSIDPNWDVNAWGIGDYYFRGEQNDYRLVNKYVEDEVCSDKEFDVLLLPTPVGWSDFTKKARRAILQRVRRGAGAVLIAPFRTKDEVSDDRIWGLSPLVRVSDHSLGGGGYLRINWQSLADGEWKWAEPGTGAPGEADPVSKGEAAAAPLHFVLRGIPAALLPSRNLKHFKYREAGTVLARAGADPLIAVKQYGKGRVIAFGYQNEGFTPPAVDPALTGVTWDYWEYYYNLLVRAVVWAAGKESPVAIGKMACDGQTLRLEITSDRARDAAVEAYLKSQWGEEEHRFTKPLALKAGANDVSWPLGAKSASCGTHIVDVILREAGKSLDWGSTTFEVPRPAQVTSIAVPDTCPSDGALGVKVSLHGFEQGDVLCVRAEDEWGRAFFSVETGAIKEVSANVPAGRALSRFVHVVTELRRGELLLDRRPSKDCYLVPGEREQRCFRAELGWAGGWKRYLGPTVTKLIADRETEIGPIGRAFLDNGIGVDGLGFGRWNMDQYAKQKRLYHATKDKAYLIRNPCLSSPEYQEELKKRVTGAVRAKAKYRLADYYVVDEGSLTSYGDAFDFCFSTHCLQRFRQWLKAKYQDIETLNEVWGTEIEEWDGVEPLTTEEAQAKGSFASWGDHRLFMCQVFADTFRLIRDTVRSVDPNGLTVISGTQAPNPWNACDWFWLDKHIDHISCYSGGEQWALHRSFKPGALVGFWTGYGASGPGVKHAIWSAFFQGITQPRIFWGYSFLDPDLTFSKSGFDMGEAFRAIKDSGLDRVVLEGKRLNDGIAIHYSYPSILAAEALGRLAQFEANKSAWVRLIKDVGLQFDFVAAPEIEQGVLAERGYRVLVLPMSTALSNKEIEQIGGFVKDGGVAVADTQTGLMRENCALRDQPAWKELGAKLTRGPIPPAAKLAEPTVSSLGKGKLMLLGYPLDAYQALRPKDYGGQPYREAVRQALGKADVRPRFQVAGGELACCEVTTFALGPALVFSILQEPQAKEIRHADGTVSFEGGGAAEGRKVKVRLNGEFDVVDVLARKSLGKATEVEVAVRPGWPTVLSLLPPGTVQGPPKVGLSVQEHVLRLSGESPAPKDAPRVFTIRLTDPKGEPRRLYFRTVLSKTNAFELEIPFALNDPRGKWRVEVLDVLSASSWSGDFTL